MWYTIQNRNTELPRSYHINKLRKFTEFKLRKPKQCTDTTIKDDRVENDNIIAEPELITTPSLGNKTIIKRFGRHDNANNPTLVRTPVEINKQPDRSHDDKNDNSNGDDNDEGNDNHDNDDSDDNDDNDESNNNGNHNDNHDNNDNDDSDGSDDSDDNNENHHSDDNNDNYDNPDNDDNDSISSNDSDKTIIYDQSKKKAESVDTNLDNKANNNNAIDQGSRDNLGQYHEVKKVLRQRKSIDGKDQYYVQFKDGGKSQNQWIPAEEMSSQLQNYVASRKISIAKPEKLNSLELSRKKPILKIIQNEHDYLSFIHEFQKPLHIADDVGVTIVITSCKSLFDYYCNTIKNMCTDLDSYKGLETVIRPYVLYIVLMQVLQRCDHVRDKLISTEGSVIIDGNNPEWSALMNGVREEAIFDDKHSYSIDIAGILMPFVIIKIHIIDEDRHIKIMPPVNINTICDSGVTADVYLPSRLIKLLSKRFDCREY